MKSYNKKYEVDNSFFDEINSIEKAYFLGLMYADGTISNRSIVIALQEEDKSILEKFKNALNYTGNLKFINYNNIKWKTEIKLCIYSRELVEALTKIGCIRRKTYNMSLPKIEMLYYSHFIRGLFDGDGCITKSKNGYYFSITGNKSFLYDINSILCKQIEINPCTISRKNKSSELSGAMQYSKNSDLIKIRNYLYNDCKDLYIERKYNKFFEIEEKKKKTCIICGDRHRAKGLCKKHYMHYYFYRNRKRIISKNIDTGEEKKFITIRDAEKELKIGYASIWANLHNRTKRSHNYIFRYEKLNNFT